MASSMASSLLRRGYRFASASARHLRHHYPLSPIASSSSHLLLAAQAAPAIPIFPGFATSAANKGEDAKLKRVLDSEIQCAEEDVESHVQDESMLPKKFSFAIIDNPGDQTITLKREFGSETIEVLVFMETSEGDVEEDEQDEEDDHSGKEEETTNISSLSLVVTIVKGKDPAGVGLEFCCTVNPNEINIDSLTLKSPDSSDDQSRYEGPEFTDLDENLQKEFYNFLEQRGIKPSLASFLQDYMIKKEEREYLTWLKNMKEFIEK